MALADLRCNLGRARINLLHSEAAAQGLQLCTCE